MCFGLYYLLLLCDASRNASISIIPNNSTKNLTADFGVRPTVSVCGDKRKREVDLSSLLQDVQTSLPKGIPLPPIFPPSNSNNKQASHSVAADPCTVAGCLQPQINVTGRSQSSKSTRPKNEWFKETDYIDSVEDYEEDIENDSFEDPPPRKIHLRRRPVVVPRRKYEGGYYRRRQLRHRVPYSRIRYVPYYDSEELPDSEEFYEEDYEPPSPRSLRSKTVKKRRQGRQSASGNQESHDLRERLKEVLKQILNEVNHQGHSNPVGMATGCHRKPADD